MTTEWRKRIRWAVVIAAACGALGMAFCIRQSILRHETDYHSASVHGGYLQGLFRNDTRFTNVIATGDTRGRWSWITLSGNVPTEEDVLALREVVLKTKPPRLVIAYVYAEGRPANDAGPVVAWQIDPDKLAD